MQAVGGEQFALRKADCRLVKPWVQSWLLPLTAEIEAHCASEQRCNGRHRSVKPVFHIHPRFLALHSCVKAQEEYNCEEEHKQISNRPTNRFPFLCDICFGSLWEVREAATIASLLSSAFFRRNRAPAISRGFVCRFLLLCHVTTGRLAPPYLRPCALQVYVHRFLWFPDTTSPRLRLP